MKMNAAVQGTLEQACLSRALYVNEQGHVDGELVMIQLSRRQLLQYAPGVFTKFDARRYFTIKASDEMKPCNSTINGEMWKLPSENKASRRSEILTSSLVS